MMATGYVIYNPHAGKGRRDIRSLSQTLGQELRYLEVQQISSYPTFLSGLEKDDFLIIAGGDGTLNRFINNTAGLEISQKILYFPAGSGNDFANDLQKQGTDTPFQINEYLKDLPTVEVDGKRYHFLNGVGYGIDGYCCQVGDRLRDQGKKVDYTDIAIKGLLFHYKPTNAKVTVDGTVHSYQKVWLAPTMYGRYYGGGMIPTPDQHRGSKEGTLSTMVFHGSGKLQTLMIFPSIFKGQHIKHSKVVDILVGKQITVEFDRPTALQIDGETVLGVTSYTATAAKVPAPV